MSAPALNLLPWRRAARIRRGRRRILWCTLVFGAVLLLLADRQSDYRAEVVRLQTHTARLAEVTGRVGDHGTVPDDDQSGPDALRARLHAGLQARRSMRDWQHLWLIAHRLAADGATLQRVALAADRAEIRALQATGSGSAGSSRSTPALPSGWRVSSVQRPGAVANSPGENTRKPVHWALRTP